MDSQRNYSPRFSFEFFPPRTSEAESKLKSAIETLAVFKPDYFSVTFGAGGSTREKTFETVVEIRDRTGIQAVPHISCIGFETTQLKTVLHRYQQENFKHIVALRGDLPSGSVGPGSFRYASELVEFIRKESGDYFHIEVACYPEFHPQSASAEKDLANFKQKVDAGADSAITQYFFNPFAYFRFIDSCEALGIGIPIVPGIMPITNCSQLVRFSEACGAEIPRWILKRLEGYGDDSESIRKFGIDVTTELCDSLLSAGAPGLHIYTMNLSAASSAIYANLGLNDPHQRAAN